MTTFISKEIADGLIRAKQLEVLNMSKNTTIDCSQILYNLAFSPKIRHIDMTGNKGSVGGSTTESIYKLLKISGSIQNLLIGETSIFNTLTDEFFVALGENKTLENLSLDIPREITSYNEAN
jgi:hypothetical protein